MGGTEEAVMDKKWTWPEIHEMVQQKFGHQLIGVQKTFFGGVLRIDVVNFVSRKLDPCGAIEKT